LRAFGLEIRRAWRAADDLRFAARLGVRTVLDIGANEGQFARAIREVLPAAQIHAFEPAAVPFAALRRMEKADPRLRAYPLAVADLEGEVPFHVNAFSPASSILEVGPLGADAFPYIRASTTESVRVTTLDGWAARTPFEEPLLIKIDVQGCEDRVLRGGGTTIRRAAALIVEVSYWEVYRGQALFKEVFDLLVEAGFRFGGTTGNVMDRASGGRILQADAIFMRL
jgi:FkbM family methyltransferase